MILRGESNVVAGAVLILCTVSAVLAAPIVTLYGTGIQANDASGNPSSVVPEGQIDPHYSIVASPSGPTAAFVTIQAGYPFTGPSAAWPSGDSQSKWISPHANQNSLNGGAANEPVGNYVYRTTFNLTGLDPTTAEVHGSFYVDNLIAALRLNGTALPVSGGGFGPTPFAVASGFVSGTNTLEFEVVNTFGAHANPSGLRVTISGSATVACSLIGDLNMDGAIDGLDIGHFVECIIDGNSPGGDCDCADLDRNGLVNGTDLVAFTGLLLAQ